MPGPSPYLLAFGDSLTAGYGLAPSEAFPAQLETLLRIASPAAAVRNAGVSGDTTASALDRLPRLLSRLDQVPDLAIVELGANDVLRGIAPARSRDNLDAILREFGRCDIPVLLASMQAPLFLGRFAAEFNAIYGNLAASHGAALHPFFPPGIMGHPDHVLRDHIHPNACAIAAVARAMLPAVTAALHRPPGTRSAA